MLQHLLFLRPSIEGVSVTTENIVFKLMYAVSTPIFLAFGVVFYTRICFSDPINCVENSTESFKVLRALEAFCMENAFVSQENEYTPEADDGPRRYLGMYQYTGLFFVLIGSFCYLPYVIWEFFENGLLNSLVRKLVNVVNVSDDTSDMHIAGLVRFWGCNKSMLNTYASAYIGCEILNFMCQLIIFWTISLFFEVNISFGLHESFRNDVVFPKTANCSWVSSGVHGESYNYEGVCSMNLNYMSEKMLFAAWWWLFICFLLTFGNVLYRQYLLRSATMRSWTLIHGHTYMVGSKTISKLESSETMKAVPNIRCTEFYENLSFGEYFILKRVQCNVPPDVFDRIITRLQSSTSKKD